jgi:hypothetical protein
MKLKNIIQQFIVENEEGLNYYKEFYDGIKNQISSAVKFPTNFSIFSFLPLFLTPFWHFLYYFSNYKIILGNSTLTARDLKTAKQAEN